MCNDKIITVHRRMVQQHRYHGDRGSAINVISEEFIMVYDLIVARIEDFRVPGQFFFSFCLRYPAFCITKTHRQAKYPKCNETITVGLLVFSYRFYTVNAMYGQVSPHRSRRF